MTIVDLPDNPADIKPELVSRLMTIISDLPWAKVLVNLWAMVRKMVRGGASEGVYEVLDYESTLELKDEGGQNAFFQKHEKVRYLQDKMIAYQDQVWGDGKILINYQCSPGIPVDRYRSGYKTHILISLREVKNKGDIDDFNFQWEIKQGFLLKTGFWATEISHRAQQFTVKVIFPKNRPPTNVSVVERNHQRTHVLEENAKVRLPDGRWIVSWTKSKPQLYEQYILNWEW